MSISIGSSSQTALLVNGECANTAGNAISTSSNSRVVQVDRRGLGVVTRGGQRSATGNGDGAACEVSSTAVTSQGA